MPAGPVCPQQSRISSLVQLFSGCDRCLSRLGRHPNAASRIHTRAWPVCHGARYCFSPLQFSQSPSSVTDISRRSTRSSLESGPSQAAVTLQAISKNPLLTPWAEAIMATHGHPDERMIGQQVALTGRVMRHHPNAIKVNRHAVYLAEAGRTEEALELFRRSALRLRPHLPDFVCSLEANQSEKSSAFNHRSQKTSTPATGMRGIKTATAVFFVGLHKFRRNR